MSSYLIRPIVHSRGVILFVFLITAIGCSGSSTSVTTPTTVAGTTVTPLHGTMSAKIDGASWTAVAITTASYSNGVLAIGGADGSNPSRTIGVGLTPAGVGTFPFASTFAAGTAGLGVGPVWSASVATGGIGTLTISTLSATAASGTFSFTAIPISGGAAGNKVVTEGVFNITF